MGYMKQGNKSMGVGVTAPMRDRDDEHPVLKEARGQTTGVVTSQKGLGKNGVPIKGKG
jgi:hypothetical protein